MTDAGIEVTADTRPIGSFAAAAAAQ